MCKSPPGTPWIRAEESFKMPGTSLGMEMLYVFYTVGINFWWEGKVACLLHIFLSFVCSFLTGPSQQDWCCTESIGWAQGEQPVLVEKDRIFTMWPDIGHSKQSWTIEMQILPPTPAAWVASLAVNILHHRLTRKSQYMQILYKIRYAYMLCIYVYILCTISISI